MPQDAYKDLYRCMHIANDWEEDSEQWTKVYGFDKDEVAKGMAKHCQKLSLLEDGYNL